VQPARPPAPIAATSIAGVEREAILAVLDRHRGNRSRAAADLGIHGTMLLRKLRRYSLK
jgi:transcriptional regulator with PAS, ATPase and Fis domain